MGGGDGGGLATDANCDAPDGGEAALTLTSFVDGVGVPIFLTHAGDDRVFVVDQGGTIFVVIILLNGRDLIQLSRTVLRGLRKQTL